jgi:hypothetical protein
MYCAPDVATCVLLQPKRGFVPAALCVANTHFHTTEQQPEVHLAQVRSTTPLALSSEPSPHVHPFVRHPKYPFPLRQVRYLATRIERFNSRVQAPLVLCGSFNSPTGQLTGVLIRPAVECTGQRRFGSSFSDLLYIELITDGFAMLPLMPHQANT